jgi:hypothetical protein
MTWWSPTKRHIQTVMINVNSHGQRMYLSVLLKFFSPCLNMLINFEN